jgi:two-component system, LytTR family, response regulator
MTCVIIDDEPLSISALSQKIGFCETKINILETFSSSKLGIEGIKELNPDLVFLDVEMPEMDGFAVLDHFVNRRFEVIFTTAHNEYAIKALRKSAVDFLLKPIDIDELNEALKTTKSKIEKNKIAIELNPPQKNDIQFNKLAVSSVRGLVFVPLKDILYMRSDKNYTTITLSNNENVVTTKTLGEYEPLLEKHAFFRIHHSTIINLEFIKEYLKGEGGTVIMSNNAELDVSRRKKKELMDIIRD